MKRFIHFEWSAMFFLFACLVIVFSSCSNYYVYETVHYVNKSLHVLHITIYAQNGVISSSVNVGDTLVVYDQKVKISHSLYYTDEPTYYDPISVGGWKCDMGYIDSVSITDVASSPSLLFRSQTENNLLTSQKMYEQYSDKCHNVYLLNITDEVIQLMQHKCPCDDFASGTDVNIDGYLKKDYALNLWKIVNNGNTYYFSENVVPFVNDDVGKFVKIAGVAYNCSFLSEHNDYWDNRIESSYCLEDIDIES